MPGQVLKGTQDGVHEVALKMISTANVSLDKLMREVALLKSCRNSNIVQVLLFPSAWFSDLLF